MQQPVWKSEAGPAMVANVGDVRLVVRTAGGHARYMMLRARQAAARPTLVASGTANNVCRAMEAAERLLRTDRSPPRFAAPAFARPYQPPTPRHVR